MSLHRLLDDPENAEPDVARLWAVATVAREFGVLPSVVAQALDRDPERIDLVCAELVQYAEAKLAYARAKDHKSRTELVRGSRLAAEVEANLFAIAKERHGNS
jgi:hypothetical protein